jgi:hypothetical protein
LCYENKGKEQNMGEFFDTMQGDSGGKVSILGGDSIGHCVKKESYKQVSYSER